MPIRRNEMYVSIDKYSLMMIFWILISPHDCDGKPLSTCILRAPSYTCVPLVGSFTVVGFPICSKRDDAKLLVMHDAKEETASQWQVTVLPCSNAKPFPPSPFGQERWNLNKYNQTSTWTRVCRIRLIGSLAFPKIPRHPRHLTRYTWRLLVLINNISMQVRCKPI